MLRGSQEEVLVVAATLPPLWEIRGGLAELETLRELRMRENLLSDAAEQFDTVQCTRSTLLRDGVNDQSWVRKF